MVQVTSVPYHGWAGYIPSYLAQMALHLHTISLALRERSSHASCTRPLLGLAACLHSTNLSYSFGAAMMMPNVQFQESEDMPRGVAGSKSEP